MRSRDRPPSGLPLAAWTAHLRFGLSHPVTGGSHHERNEGSRRACCHRRPNCSRHLFRCWVVLPRGPGPMRRVCAPLQSGRGQSGLSPPYLRQPRCRPIIWFCPIAGWRLARSAQLPPISPHMPSDRTIGGLVAKLDVLRIECPTCADADAPSKRRDLRLGFGSRSGRAARPSAATISGTQLSRTI